VEDRRGRLSSTFDAPLPQARAIARIHGRHLVRAAVLAVADDGDALVGFVPRAASVEEAEAVRALRRTPGRSRTTCTGVGFGGGGAGLRCCTVHHHHPPAPASAMAMRTSGHQTRRGGAGGDGGASSA
jgi:hypothetical protein